MGERPVSSVRTAEYDNLLTALRQARSRANLTQRELSARLGRSASYIDKVERGVRRLDVIEFLEICQVLRANPHEVIDGLINPLQ